jgi:hypothetical protein
VQIVPRPGRLVQADLPIAVMGEAELRTIFEKPNEAPKPISNLHLQLTDWKGDVVRDGYSALDGSLFFENLPPGSFSVRLEPGQAVKLKLQLAEPVTVTIKPGGGFAGRIVVPVQPLTPPLQTRLPWKLGWTGRLEGNHASQALHA